MRSTGSLLLRKRVVVIGSINKCGLIYHKSESSTIRHLEMLGREQSGPFTLLITAIKRTRGLYRVDERRGRLLRSPRGPVILLGEEGGDVPLVDPTMARLARDLNMFLPPFKLCTLLTKVGVPLIIADYGLAKRPVVCGRTSTFTFCRDRRDVSTLFCSRERVLHPTSSSIAHVTTKTIRVLHHAHKCVPRPITMRGGKVHILTLNNRIRPSFTLSIGSLVCSTRIPSSLALRGSSTFCHHLITS